MKILFLSAAYPHPAAPVRGTFNRDLCQALSADAQVRVIAPFPWTESVRNTQRRLRHRLKSIWAPPPDESSTRTPGRPSVPGPASIPASHPLFLYPAGVFRHTYGTWMWNSVRHSVRAAVSGFSPDWVLSYWAHPDGEAGLRAARVIGCRSGVIIGGSDVLLLTREPRRCRAITRVLNGMDAVFTVCEGLRRRVIELGVAPERVHTILQGVNPQLFSAGDPLAARRRLGLPEDAPVFLWVGRMVPIKRLDVLIDAFARVQKKQPDAVLCLAGGGALLASVQNDVRERGLTDHVRFAGMVDSSELQHWYRAANATVLSSDSEGLPNVLRESLACGTPFVSTDVGSVVEIADPEHSLLAPAAHVGKFAEAMLSILDTRFQTAASTYRPRLWSDTARDFLTVMDPDHCAETDAATDAPAMSADELPGLGFAAGNVITTLNEQLEACPAG